MTYHKGKIFHRAGILDENCVKEIKIHFAIS